MRNTVVTYSRKFADILPCDLRYQRFEWRSAAQAPMLCSQHFVVWLKIAAEMERHCGPSDFESSRIYDVAPTVQGERSDSRDFYIADNVIIGRHQRYVGLDTFATVPRPDDCDPQQSSCRDITSTER